MFSPCPCRVQAEGVKRDLHEEDDGGDDLQTEGYSELRLAVEELTPVTDPRGMVSGVYP